MIDTLAIEGGSLYLKNVYNFVLSKSSFLGQDTLIRGGSIYMTQEEKYFGLPYDNSVYTFTENLFEQSSSQQGGAIYDHHIMWLDLDSTNVLRDNIAVRYGSEFRVQASGLDLEHSKVYERLFTR